MARITGTKKTENTYSTTVIGALDIRLIVENP